ncbi:response regulator [Defluviimonas salinarum]|uniref:Response regulator n=1 Tax=Defluviimonas salinarum TaxID=2992147 RepID=A0ABT3JAN8_9RHOB|nr:response regulator [Defluviimonas salinarum]MCW3784739.1 response regulator [Defluviimonas salinarum]
MSDSVRILVVDDSSVSRAKLRLAVVALGHQAVEARDGSEALQLLGQHPYDAILLDIVMPGLDGFDVLEAMRRDDILAEIPVIVVSALDDDMSSVVRAIELGATDFLPKDFDPVILRARLETSIRKRRLRERERAYLDQVEELNRAAQIILDDEFSPDRMNVDDVAARDDALGTLARVLARMADEIYDREVALRRQVITLKGILMVIALGVIWGVVPTLSHIAADLDATPVGLAIWVNLLAGLMCLAVALSRKRLSLPGRGSLRFLLAWAVLGGVFQNVTIYWIAGHVEATTLALVSALEGFMVFALAAMFGVEKATLRRLVGLVVGLVGVVTVLLSRGSLASSTEVHWVALALLVPFLFAVEDLGLSTVERDELDPVNSVGFMMLLSVPMMMPLALATDGFLQVGPTFGQTELVVVLMGAASASATIILVLLIAMAGAVFAAQSAYAVTIAGIVWSMLILGESMSVTAWSAVGIMFLGLYLVEPEAGEETIQIRMPFKRSPRVSG